MLVSTTAKARGAKTRRRSMIRDIIFLNKCFIFSVFRLSVAVHFFLLDFPVWNRPKNLADSRQSKFCDLFERFTVRIELGDRPHALNCCDEKSRQRRRILLG